MRDEEKESVERQLRRFRRDWNITYPLHSYSIRNKKRAFGWLSHEPRYQRFMGALAEMLCSLPIVTLACTIDRQGYDDRYRPKYE